VAQQYLPDTLQGKLFYQPSDQGYEEAIREQVLRRREAQLEAMMEADRRSSEVLTFSKGSRVRDLWLQRVVSRTSQQLSTIRDTIFSDLTLSRHHLLLDLNAGEGLLSWEALRCVPEGGVWSLCADAAAASALQSRAEALSELERPRILIGAVKDLPDLLERAGEGEVRFDAVVGRNALFRDPDKAGCLKSMSALLQPEGTISLAEVVPSEGMRLSALLDLASESEEFRQKLARAEEAIYTDADNPLVNWNAEDFIGLFVDAGFTILYKDCRRFTDLRTIRKEDIERWFATQKGNYADQASVYLDSTELGRLKGICIDQLLTRPCDWHSTVLFVRAGKEAVG
jgi:putative ATPase